MVKEEVDEDDIAAVVSSWTGIPVSRLLEGEVEKLIHMEERLHKRVVGQDQAVEAVANALRRARSGLQDPNRPIGSFIFLGPTGVGKTELARALAEFMFDDERAMVRLDMSEYQERHTVARLIGAPPGYVGYEEGGQLTEAVRRRPYTVVLLDEIEKAHSEVFDVLLQLLDDGRLTDGQGRTVDFRNTVIIMTSNIRSQNELRDRFRPEFLNRVDEVVTFEPLTREQLAEIVDLQLERLRARLAERRISLEVDGRSPRRRAGSATARPLSAQSAPRGEPARAGAPRGPVRRGDIVRVDAVDGGSSSARLVELCAAIPTACSARRAGDEALNGRVIQDGTPSWRPCGTRRESRTRRPQSCSEKRAWEKQLWRAAVEHAETGLLVLRAQPSSGRRCRSPVWAISSTRAEGRARRYPFSSDVALAPSPERRGPAAAPRCV
jgi:ATP-dependent Clp protease ATP-binding subunit ClpB